MASSPVKKHEPAVSSLREAAAVLRNAKRALRGVSGQRKAQLQQAINHLNTILGRAERVVAQARNRLAGVMAESVSRLVSLHDVEARPIRKGRLGKPVSSATKPRSSTMATGSSSTTASRWETRQTPRS